MSSTIISTVTIIDTEYCNIVQYITGDTEWLVRACQPRLPRRSEKKLLQVWWPSIGNWRDYESDSGVAVSKGVILRCYMWLHGW